MVSDGDLSNAIYVVGNTNPSGRGIGEQVYDADGIYPTITVGKGEGTKILIRENTKKGYVEAYEGDGIRLYHIGGTTGRGRVQSQMCNTLTTGSNAGVIDKGFRIRKLTPKECWRLQGWKDEDFEKAAKVCSDSQLYKQDGNGVTVPVIYEIAKRFE